MRFMLIMFGSCSYRYESSLHDYINSISNTTLPTISSNFLQPNKIVSTHAHFQQFMKWSQNCNLPAIQSFPTIIHIKNGIQPLMILYRMKIAFNVHALSTYQSFHNVIKLYQLIKLMFQYSWPHLHNASLHRIWNIICSCHVFHNVSWKVWPTPQHIIQTLPHNLSNHLDTFFIDPYTTLGI